MSILDWIMIILLVLGVVTGYRQGLMKQLVKLVSFFASFVIAVLFYKPLSQKLTEWVPLSQESGSNFFSSVAGSEPIAGFLYTSAAFVLLLIGSGIVLRLIGTVLDGIAQLPVISTFNHLGGGLLGFIKSGLVIFLLLMIASALPLPDVQQTIQESVIGTFVVENSPGVLQFFKGIIQGHPSDIPMGEGTSF